jgi:hypothetical protein
MDRRILAAGRSQRINQFLPAVEVAADGLQPLGFRDAHLNDISQLEQPVQCSLRVLTVESCGHDFLRPGKPIALRQWHAVRRLIRSVFMMSSVLISVYSALNQSGKEKAVGRTKGSLRERKTEAPLFGDIRPQQANQTCNFAGVTLEDPSISEA